MRRIHWVWVIDWIMSWSLIPISLMAAFWVDRQLSPKPIFITPIDFWNILALYLIATFYHYVRLLHIMVERINAMPSPEDGKKPEVVRPPELRLALKWAAGLTVFMYYRLYNLRFGLAYGKHFANAVVADDSHHTSLDMKQPTSG